LSFPAPRHTAMTNEQSTMNNEQSPDDYISKIPPFARGGTV
jgi:hypothetical protein